MTVRRDRFDPPTAPADRLYGEGEADALFGNAGHDHLFGGWGADRLDGGPGVSADWLVGLTDEIEPGVVYTGAASGARGVERRPRARLAPPLVKIPRRGFRPETATPCPRGLPSAI